MRENGEAVEVQTNQPDPSEIDEGKRGRERLHGLQISRVRLDRHGNARDLLRRGAHAGRGDHNVTVRREILREAVSVARSQACNQQREPSRGGRCVVHGSAPKITNRIRR